MVKIDPVKAQVPVSERAPDKAVKGSKEDSRPSGDTITLSEEAKKRLLMGKIMARLSASETAKKG